jgi:hypothetical protein
MTSLKNAESRPLQGKPHDFTDIRLVIDDEDGRHNLEGPGRLGWRAGSFDFVEMRFGHDSSY